MNSWYSQCVPKGFIPEKPEPVDMASADDECYHMFSELSLNALVQSFPSNPDSEATAYVVCKYCSRSGMQCTDNVLGGRTQLVASHIHLASDGDGENGAGPPVINFCGDNGPGMIADGSSYKSPCAHFHNRAALMSMTGNFVDGAQNAGFTLASPLKGIAANPSKYYVNFHSIAMDALADRGQGSSGNGPRRYADKSEEVGLCAGVARASSCSRLNRE